jgi:hypothetical protein
LITKKKNSRSSAGGADPASPARKALRIIWLTGIVCVVTGIFFIYNSSASVGAVNGKQAVNHNINSIDQLLLSSDEALLADKKSFVNGALRFQWRSLEPDLNQGRNRTILYNNILKKKLQRIPRAQVSDFSVKPVPK